MSSTKKGKGEKLANPSFPLHKKIHEDDIGESPDDDEAMFLMFDLFKFDVFEEKEGNDAA